MTRRGRILLLLLAALLVSGGLGAALLSARRIEGSIPGRATVLSLAAVSDGLLAGTADGLYVSPEGKRWARSARFSRGSVVVKSVSSGALLALGDRLYSASRLDSFEEVGVVRTAGSSGSSGSLGRRETVSAVAGGRVGTVASTTSGLMFVRQEGMLMRQLDESPPRGVLSLAVDDSTIYAAGPGIGLWVSENAGSSWSQVLATPAAAIEIENEGQGRIFLGTPGGLLVSDPNKTWRFTQLRIRIDGLSHRDGEFFAVSDRIVYESQNGDSDWRAIPSIPAGESFARRTKD